MPETFRNYDRWKLDNGETRARLDDYESDEEIELPLTCQKCKGDYWYSDKGATAGYCPRCNGVDRRVGERREVIEAGGRRLATMMAVIALAMFALGFSFGYYEAAKEGAAMVLGAK